MLEYYEIYGKALIKRLFFKNVVTNQPIFNKNEGI